MQFFIRNSTEKKAQTTDLPESNENSPPSPKKQKKEYKLPDFNAPFVVCLIKSLQIDRRIKNVLSLAREATTKIIADPYNEEVLRKYSNILENKKEAFWINAAYLLSMIISGVKKKHSEIVGKSLTGMEGFWDVSMTVNMHETQ